MMSSSDGVILLVVSNQKRMERYLAVLGELSVPCRVAPSLRDAVASASEEMHRGILIDMPLMVRISSFLKVGVEDLINALPSATLNIHAASGDIRILPRGPLTASCNSIESFVGICRRFEPRIVYSRKRKPIHFNVLLDMASDFANPVKTVCMDISIGGCFLFYSGENIEVGNRVWVRFVDSACTVSVEATVCWVRRWGATRHIPGIGLQFEAVPAELKDELD